VVSAVPSIGSKIMVEGWAFDLDRPTAPVRVAISVNGMRVAAAPTRQQPVGFELPGQTWYSALVEGRNGRNRVCATALNLGRPGSNTPLGCRAVIVDHGPNGGIISAFGDAQDGGIAVDGWAYDPDAPDAQLYIGLSVDGTQAPEPSLLRADRAAPRYDVLDTFGYGSGSNFRGVVTAGAGPHTVCLFAQNVGPGVDRLLGCRTVTVDPSS